MPMARNLQGGAPIAGSIHKSCTKLVDVGKRRLWTLRFLWFLHISNGHHRHVKDQVINLWSRWEGRRSGRKASQVTNVASQGACTLASTTSAQVRTVAFNRPWGHGRNRLAGCACHRRLRGGCWQRQGGLGLWHCLAWRSLYGQRRQAEALHRCHRFHLHGLHFHRLLRGRAGRVALRLAGWQVRDDLPTLGTIDTELIGTRGQEMLQALVRLLQVQARAWR
mmetsp:Transcript_51554/g.112286  ORF Transcript_51554/g.112286 Transcript_51554/m.112286 type:complete len:222 (+) Transcript_51554:1226-1891(+)